MTKSEAERLVAEAYLRGYQHAVDNLEDTEQVHDWLSLDGNDDLYDLMPSSRRSAVAFLRASRPAGVPRDALR